MFRVYGSMGLENVVDFIQHGISAPEKPERALRRAAKKNSEKNAETPEKA
jgi:hypothetical protein